MLPDTDANNCLQVWHDILQAYPTGSKSQFTSLTLSQFCDPSKELGGVIGQTGNYPSLKREAGNMKHSIRPLHQVFARYARNMQVDETNMAEVLRITTEMHEALDSEEGAFVPPELAEHILANGRQGIKRFAALSNAVAQPPRRWSLAHILPHHHWMIHLLQRPRYLHPRIGCTASGEDFNMKSRDLVQSCARGMALHKIPAIYLDKWRVANYLALTGSSPRDDLYD